MKRRPLIWLSTILVFTFIWLGLPWLSSERGVKRSWDRVTEAIEKRDYETLGKYLQDDYRDGFGLGRAEALEVLTSVRAHFIVCWIQREAPELVMDPQGKAAISRAIIRLGGQGSPIAQAAIQASNTTSTPTTFRWRKNTWKPWDWRLVSIENPDATRALQTFQRQASSLGL